MNGITINGIWVLLGVLWTFILGLVGLVLRVGRTPAEVSANLSEWKTVFHHLAQRFFRLAVVAMVILLFIGGLGVGLWRSENTEQIHAAREAENQTQISNLQVKLDKAINDRDRANKDYNDLAVEFNKLRAQIGPKSQFLGLDDAARWNIATSMSNMVEHSPCQSRLAFEQAADNPEVFKPLKVFKELDQPLHFAGWTFGIEGKTIFPHGITITTATPGGHERDCAVHFSDLLKSLNVSPVTLIVDEHNQDLIECKCVEVVLGRLDKP